MSTLVRKSKADLLEEKFYAALRDVFVGAKVEGDSGYINLMRIKSRYFTEGVFPKLKGTIKDELVAFPDFKGELFDKLYTFFHRYFSESGSIYFRHTPLHQNVYERVYTNERDVMLFWKTHMLYYVKTDRLFRSLTVEPEEEGGLRFFFDASTLQNKKNNEKRELVFEFRERRESDGTLVFTVSYSEKGRKTKTEEIIKQLKKEAKAKATPDELERAFRLFERQSEVDYFINRDARQFLEEQFRLWLYQYVFRGENVWTARRIAELQALQRVAMKIIDFIAQFENELVKIWNKPKFARRGNYVITLDKIAERDEALARRLLKDGGMKGQAAEWRELNIVGAGFKAADVWKRDLTGEHLDERYRFLPVDTRHFKELEQEILALFDDLDDALDGWLIRSENYQALNTILPKFRERVKCIYIDPPYNTGSDEFVYKDAYQHSSWLSMMLDRLSLARDLLREDGVAFVSISDNEVHNLRSLMGEVFGELDFVAELVWEKGRKNDAKFFSVGHEYMLSFARSMAKLRELRTVWREPKPGAQEIWSTYIRLKGAYGEDHQVIEEHLQDWYNSLPKNHPSKALSRYKHVDKFGPWRDRDISWNGGSGPRYEVIHPVTKKPCKIPDRGWGFATPEKMQRQIELGLVIFREDHTQPPFRKAHLRPIPEELDDDNDISIAEEGEETEDSVAVGMQVMPSVIYKQSQVAVKHLRNLMGKKVFDNPKDHEVIARILRYCTSIENVEIVCDFFAGSGTTAHAVINLNREDGGRRKYVLVEANEYFHTVILPRVKKVVFADKWKDGKPVAGSTGTSHFCKYYELEQYEETLQRVKYEDSTFFDNPYEDPFHSYVFLRDVKLLDAVEVDTERESVKVDFAKLYPDVDAAETLSNLLGKRIRRLAPGEVEFADGEKIDLNNLDFRTVKPLIWWQ